MPNRFEVISHPNKFRLKPGIWVEPPGTTTTEWPITTTTEEPDVQYVYYDDGIVLWRKGVRDGCFVWDKALTPVGFNGIEDTDWENVRTLCPGESSTTTDDGIIQYVIYYDGITLWRKGVRDGCFVWDRAITLTGFDGIEDTDWENVRMLCGVGTTTTESPGLGLGLLYNWYAATDARNICAEGWRVPLISDWIILGLYLDPDADYGEYGEASYYIDSYLAGGKLKELGEVYWNYPNLGATNEVGFNGKGSGWRLSANWAGYDYGGFYDLKVINNLWAGDSTLGFARAYFIYDDTFFSAENYNDANNETFKRNGYSIRLVKDTTTLTHGQTSTYTGNDGKVYRTICIGTQEWLADNLAETKFRNGEDIPEVTDNDAWAALTSAGMCAYNNDWSNV